MSAEWAELLEFPKLPAAARAIGSAVGLLLDCASGNVPQLPSGLAGLRNVGGDPYSACQYIDAMSPAMVPNSALNTLLTFISDNAEWLSEPGFKALDSSDVSRVRMLSLIPGASDMRVVLRCSGAVGRTTRGARAGSFRRCFKNSDSPGRLFTGSLGACLC